MVYDPRAFSSLGYFSPPSLSSSYPYNTKDPRLRKPPAASDLIGNSSQHHSAPPDPKRPFPPLPLTSPAVVTIPVQTSIEWVTKDGEQQLR